MPSPLIHLAAGAAAGAWADARAPRTAPTWKVLLFCLFFTMLPDADVALGLLHNDLSAFHNQWTHSLCFVLAASLVFAWLGRYWLTGWSFRRIWLLLLLLLGSHVVLDWLTWGRGLKLLWPFSDHRFAAPWPLFYGVRHSERLCSASHWITLGSECVTLVAAWAVWRLWRHRSRKHSTVEKTT